MAAAATLSTCAALAKRTRATHWLQGSFPNLRDTYCCGSSSIGFASTMRLYSLWSSAKPWGAGVSPTWGTGELGRRAYSGLHQFDTYKLVQRLEADGFSRESAEAIMASLSEVVGESINNISRTSVTKSDFEKAMYINKVDFAHVRNEIQMLEKNDFALLRSDIGRLNAEVEKFRTRMIEDLRRVQSNVRLELSLEKGRIRDEQSAQELKIKEADSRIDTEVSTLRTQMETIQWELFKTLFPLFCAAGALFFSYLRFVK
ncbi:hypothetical protein, variant [Spizellomyces punctatus DAOM BR117]|uniref:DUF1640 domain-containing protein n=1 Tax=Spizellomyces punctatus (strain DAOM BR117) TaxID=645134 RepID=A0A0L0HNS3_SPIPD|nr:hypothetical protein, variant [Spizellomyces punctatus DAOM BR117]KND02585.1 hypothetical protein, variant [Spizellomyces punctatus DAOM BR117]|eukprot:XP_016610624.1 hypothetical protein, variant [Spizellomyces punctatus DAOM BR117]